MAGTGSSAKLGAKLGYVETVRGAACLLLVAYHVVGNTADRGMMLEGDHPLRLANALFADMRMPLFSFISGFVFAAFAPELAVLWKKIGSKARRLLVPLITVGSLHFFVQSAVQGEAPTDYWRIFILPYDHFWFLQATFLLMLFLLVGSYLLKLRPERLALIALPFCILAYVLVERWRPDLFSSWKALYLAPYFLSGLIWAALLRAERTRDWIESRRFALLTPVLITCAALLAFEAYLLFSDVKLAPQARLALGVAMGLVTCLTLMLARLEAKPLMFIGDKSYAIFLFHVFFTAGSRIALQRLWPEAPELVVFATGLTLGIAGPIALSALILRNRWSAFLLLGLSPKGKPRGAREKRTVTTSAGNNLALTRD